ncbi:DUF2812 domain-containing protein [Oscillibacter sp. GMB15532]|uniref:DUF2812 domain-containing protein n=1 Tax=Oscillibacter sp. GMB15532 TaxID=3230022 RepID=UPI0034DFCAFD
MPEGLMERDGEEAKEVRKRMRSDLFDLDHNESWFSDLAERGLFLDRFEGRYAWFKRGTPRKLRYRMDVLSRELTEDELLLYDSAGWHIAATATWEGFRKDVFYYVFQNDGNASVPELHTDPVEQAESLKRLYQRLRRDLWLELVLIGIVYWFYYREGRPELAFKQMVEREPIREYWLFLCFLNFWSILRGWLNVRRLRRRLAGGETLNHRADYRRVHRRFRMTDVLRWALLGWLLAVIAAQLIGAASSRTGPLPEGEPAFPAVRLEEVYDGALSKEGVSGNCSHRWTVAGAAINSLWEEGREGKTNGILNLYTVCIRLPFVRTAERAFAALTEMDTYMAYRLEGIAPVETELVDEAWAASPAAENRNQFILLVRDGRYIVMTFYLDRTDGNLDAPEAEAFRDRCTERLLPMLAQKLED